MRTDTSLGGLASLSSILLTLTTAAVALRFYARHKQRVQPQIDDWLTVPAWVFFVGLTAISFYGMSHGFMGFYMPHNKSIVNAIHPTMEKIYLSLDALSILTFGLVKLSALFFYRRVLCSGQQSMFKVITTFTIVLVSLWTVTFFIMLFFTCGSNINFLWAPGHSAQCKLIFTWFMITAISDFVLDVWVIGLPIPKIWSLHITTKRKMAVSAVFLMALAGLGASTARMVIVAHLVTVGRAIDDEDSYQSNTQSAYYIILEAGLGLFAVNMPSLWYFMADVNPDNFLRSVRSMTSLYSKKSSSPTSSKPSSQHDPDRSRSVEQGTEIVLSPMEKKVEARGITDNTGLHLNSPPQAYVPGRSDNYDHSERTEHV